MNKRNKILLGILAFVLVCVVGYALFSENITVTGTATAKGDFKFTMTCHKGDYYNIGFGTEGGYGTESCTTTNNSITISTELLYPSAFRVYSIDVKNTGTVDAMIKLDDDGLLILDETISINSETMKLYNKKTNALYKSFNSMEEIAASDETDEYGYVGGPFIFGMKEDGSAIISDADYTAQKMVYKDNQGNKYFKFAPGESIIIVFMSEWPSYSIQTDYYAVDTISYNVYIKQFTPENLQLDTNVELCQDGC